MQLRQGLGRRYLLLFSLRTSRNFRFIEQEHFTRQDGRDRKTWSIRVLTAELWWVRLASWLNYWKSRDSYCLPLRVWNGKYNKHSAWSSYHFRPLATPSQNLTAGQFERFLVTRTSFLSRSAHETGKQRKHIFTSWVQEISKACNWCFASNLHIRQIAPNFHFRSSRYKSVCEFYSNLFHEINPLRFCWFANIWDEYALSPQCVHSS